MAELLAKPDVPLIVHLKDVLNLGRGIADRLELSEPLRSKALLACALHDIGKATNDFQEYIRGKRGKSYPHALASMPIALIVEQEFNQHHGWPKYDLSATATVLTHHSPLGPTLYYGYAAPTWHPAWQEALEAVYDLLTQVGVAGLPDLARLKQVLQVFLNQSPAALLDTSLQLPDGRYKTLRGIFQSMPALDFAQVKSVLHLADWLASARETDSKALFMDLSEPELYTTLQQEIATKQPNALWREFQRRARLTSADVLWLRAPTGTGKTEALLLWADGTERLIYLLPTQATVNAMWRRLRRIYGEARVGLAHGRASYILRKESDEDPLDTRLFGSVFAKPITVATLDQFLLAHLHGRHWEERRTLARRATVILDEIHAYEPFTLGLLLEALNREHPARLALASATLPSILLALFPNGTLVEAEKSLWQRCRHRIEWCEGTLFDALPDSIQLARQGKSVLLVANTVRDAQLLYQRLRDEFGWKQRHLLHARFTLGDRQRKEEKVEKSTYGTIFIATQVVEVSLDISYDVLLTEIAPVDAMVQRMGRVNRRGEHSPAPVIVCRQWSKGAQHVYGREILEWSLEILTKIASEPTDADLANATSQLYERVIPTKSWQEEFADGRRTLDEVQRVLGCYTIDLSDEKLRDKFVSRRGIISIEVLPRQFVEQAYQLKEQKELWRLPELLVPVPVYWVTLFREAFTPLEDLNLLQTQLPYDPELGLLPDENWQAHMEAAII